MKQSLVRNRDSDIDQIPYQNTGVKRRVGDESPHTRDECNTQGCHVVFHTDRNNELCC